jgi:hypothetical protein
MSGNGLFVHEVYEPQDEIDMLAGKLKAAEKRAADLERAIDVVILRGDTEIDVDGENGVLLWLKELIMAIAEMEEVRNEKK